MAHDRYVASHGSPTGFKPSLQPFIDALMAKDVSNAITKPMIVLMRIVNGAYHSVHFKQQKGSQLDG